MDVQIRFFDAGTLSDPARFADAYARVSAPRRAKIDRLRPGASRRLSLAAGLLLADTLAENGVRGLSAEEAEDENGKPCMKKWFDVTDVDVEKMLNATTWNAADNGYFRGGGFSSRFLTRGEMPATMIRINWVKGLGPTIQICEGYYVALPDEVSDVLWKRCFC